MTRIGGRDCDRLESMLTAAGIDHDVKVHPGAGHGFLNNHNPGELPSWVKAIAKLANASCDEPSAHDARHRMVAFFRPHLGEAGT